MSKLKIGKKSGLRYFGYDDIKTKWNSCYDPIRYLPINWRGTAIDIINNERIPVQDRLWCVLRPEIVSEKLMRLFAVWSYRQTLKFIKNPDPRSIKAADVAELFANGVATAEQLEEARSAAWLAARSAASAAAYAARLAAESAWSAAASTASAAAWLAAWSAAWSAASAESAASAASAAARSAQKDKLIEMIQTEAKERKGNK